MNWIQENLQVLSTVASAIGLYIFIRSGARKESLEIKEDLKEIRNGIKDINERLSRLEGRFEERGYWESREYRKNGTEEK